MTERAVFKLGGRRPQRPPPEILIDSSDVLLRFKSSDGTREIVYISGMR